MWDIRKCFVAIALCALVVALVLLLEGCGFAPAGGGGDDGPLAAAEIAGATPATIGPPPLVAEIFGCWFEGEGTPEYLGHLVGRADRLVCAVKNGQSCIGRLTDGAGNIREFPLLPTGQDQQWAGSFLPNLGPNGLQVSCTGDQGTDPAVEMVPDFGAMEFVFTGGGVQVVSPGHYRGEVAGNVTRCWNIPGADPETCWGEATVGGNPAPQYGFGGPHNCPVDCLRDLPINGAPAEVVFWLTASPANPADPSYRTGVIYEVLPPP